jgi:pseudouridine kinase
MVSENKSVLVIGGATVDTKGRAKGALVPATSNDGEVIRTPGGCARNIAENLARLGVETTLITAVGDDADGRELVRQAAESGINADHILVSPGSRTGSYVAILQPDGSLAVGVADIVVNTAITPQYLAARKPIFQGADMIAIDASLPVDTLTFLFRLAARYKVPVCADPTSLALAPRLRPFLNQLTLVTPNAAEAEALCGCSPIIPGEEALSAARCVVGSGAGIAIITMAEEGLTYATTETGGRIPAIRTEVVDYTGAGDALTAAVIFGLLNDFSVDDAVRLGVSAATLTLRSRETVVPNLSLDVLYESLVI